MNIVDYNKSANTLSYYVFAYILLMIGFINNSGLFFHQAQLWFLFAGWIILFMPLLKNSWLNFDFRLKPVTLLIVANIFSFLLFYLFDGGIYLSSKQAFDNLFLLKFIAVGLFFLYFINFDFRRENFFSFIFTHLKRHKFIYLIAIAIILRLATIFYSPTPLIDVFWVVDSGAEQFLQGNNPYSEVFFKVYQGPDYINNVYPYWPATIFLTTFFKLLFGDARFTQLFAQLGAASLLYLLARGKEKSLIMIKQLLVLLFLYLPVSLFVLEQTWSEPLSIFFLYLFVFFNIANYRYLPYFTFGILISIKQLSLIFLVFLIKLKYLTIKQYLLPVYIWVFIALPFIFWNSVDFFKDTFYHHIFFEVPAYSLTFNSLYKIYFYDNIPLIISLGLLLAMFIFLMIRSSRDLQSIIHSSILFLLSLFLIKQGFTNYYYSILGGIILLIVLEIAKPYYSKNILS